MPRNFKMCSIYKFQCCSSCTFGFIQSLNLKLYIYQPINSTQLYRILVQALVDFLRDIIQQKKHVQFCIMSYPSAPQFYLCVKNHYVQFNGCYQCAQPGVRGHLDVTNTLNMLIYLWSAFCINFITFQTLKAIRMEDS